MQTQQEFNDFEKNLRERLKGLSLVVEANIDEKLAVSAFRILGENFRLRNTKESRGRLLKEYRAALAVGLCSVGARRYDEGIFWPSVAESFGCTLGQQEQQEISEAFRLALDSFQLSRFTTPQRNIGEILMHAGIPIPSIESFLRALLKRDALTPNLEGRQFCSWARTLPRELAASLGLDAPTWRFLTEGGEISEDFTDRVLALLDEANCDASGSIASDELPAAVSTEILRLVSSGILSSPSARTQQRKRAEDVHPRLVFVANEGVRVKLPPLELITESELSWRITAEGRTHSIEVRAPWPGDPVVPLFQTIGIPAKFVTVSVQPSNQSWNLELVDLDDPLVVFEAETGDWVPPRHTLPKASLWLAYVNPDGKPVGECIETDLELRVLGTIGSPYGWDGWSFSEVDGASITKLRLRHAKRWRYVSSITRPVVHNLSPLEFVQTEEGRSVSSTRPHIVLPPVSTADDSSAQNMSWLVSIVRRADNVQMAVDTFDSTSVPREIDPWPMDCTLVVGEFDISVRGPLGRGLNARVAIAEGVIAQANTQFRFMNTAGTGLDPAEVILATPEPSLIAPMTIALLPTQRTKSCHLSDGIAGLDLTIAVPHMSVGIMGTGQGASTIAPQQLDLESLATASLRIAIPSSVRAELVVFSGTNIIQTIRAGEGQKQGTRLYNLAQISGTMASIGSASLSLNVDERGIPVGRIRPVRLADSVTVTAEGVLEVGGALTTQNLSCGIYPTFAPWLKPYVVTFENGKTSLQLSADVLGESRATVVLRIDDPWAPEPWPDLPAAEAANVFKVKLSDLADLPGVMESGFRSWLARTGECPQRVESVPLALTIYSLLRRIRPDVPRAVLRRELAAAVRSNRTEVVNAVLETQTQSRDLMRLFVESDVVTVPGEAWAATPLLWAYSGALGILADSDLLKTMDEATFINDVANHAGDSATKIIQTGADRDAGVGRFNDTIRSMHPWPEERIDAVWKIVSPLPGRLLDRDPRASAAKELFDHRNDRDLKNLASSSRRLIIQARAVVTADIGPDATGPISARESTDGWADLPALSMAFAICARLAARGSETAHAYYRSTKEHYANLAHAAPSIVERDLALAELWVTRWRNE